MNDPYKRIYNEHEGLSQANATMSGKCHRILQCLNGYRVTEYPINGPCICLEDIRYGDKFKRYMEMYIRLLGKHFGGRVLSVEWSNIRNSECNPLGNMGRYVLTVTGDEIQNVLDKRVESELPGELQALVLPLFDQPSPDVSFPSCS